MQEKLIRQCDETTALEGQPYAVVRWLHEGITGLARYSSLQWQRRPFLVVYVSADPQ